jgi:hypothetical protein
MDNRLRLIPSVDFVLLSSHSRGLSKTYMGQYINVSFESMELNRSRTKKSVGFEFKLSPILALSPQHTDVR